MPTWTYKKYGWQIRQGPFEFLIHDPARWLDHPNAPSDFRAVTFRIWSERRVVGGSMWSVRLSKLPSFEYLLADRKEHHQNKSARPEAYRLLYPDILGQAEALATRVLESESAKAFIKGLGRTPPVNLPYWDDFNPDTCTSPDELEPWIEFIGEDIEYAARLWFPNQPDKIRTTTLILHYLRKKRLAMRSRLTGHIHLALRAERRADLYYRQMPDYARW